MDKKEKDESAESILELVKRPRERSREKQYTSNVRGRYTVGESEC